MMRERRRRWAATALLLCFVIAPCASALDEVTLTDRIKKYTGAVLAENYDTVEVDTNGDGKADESIPTTQVLRIVYDDTPADFRNAERAFGRERYGEAADLFKRVLEEAARGGVRRFWAEPHAWYYLGECARRQAGLDPAKYDEAAEIFQRVIETHPKARRVPDCLIGLARSRLGAGRLDEAAQAAEKAASGAYGPEPALWGTVVLAEVRARQRQADQSADLVKQARRAAGAPEFKGIALEVDLACAQALAAAGRGDEAYDILRERLQKHTEAETDARARIYNTMGDCFLAQDQVKEALLSYLRVRLLYFKSRDELPRALYGTAICFRALKQGARAEEVVRELVQTFGDSRWAEMARREFPSIQ